MKTAFSFPRFYQFFKREIIGNHKNYLYQMLMMYLVMTIALIWTTVVQYPSDCWKNEDFYFMAVDEMSYPGLDIFLLGGLAFTCLAPSFYKYSNLQNKAKRIEQLMLPVSTLEQYIAQGLLCTLGAGLLYIISFITADLTRNLFVSIFYPGIVGHGLIPIWKFYENFIGLDIFSLRFFMMLSILLLIQSLYFFTSYFWVKMSFLKTSALLFIATCIYIIHSNYHAHDPRPDMETSMLFYTCLFAITSLFLWILGYFRLKEAEVISRK